MAGLDGLFDGESQLSQFFIWGVMQQVAGALLGPAVTELSKLVNSATPTTPLSADQAAQLVVRKLIDDGTGRDIANDNGIGGNDFEKLVTAGGRAPDLGTVVAAYHRQYIGEAGGAGTDVSLDGALIDAGIRPEWFDAFKKAIIDWPSRQEVMNALLEGQITQPVAYDWYIKAGGNPDWFQIDFDANGSAPTPNELNVMTNRGIIPADGEGPTVVSFHQGFLEGPWRNKWEAPMRKLGLYIPPPRTITALVHEGAVTDAQALAWFQDTGMSAETAAVYLKSAHSTKTAAAKGLTVSNIEALYKAGLVTVPEATAQLVALGYPATSAAELLKLADFNTAHASVTTAVNRVKTLYVQHKITKANATDALTKLGQPAETVTALLQVWDVEISVNVKQLTEAQVVSAWGYLVLTDDEAIGNLQAIGYTPYDAWVLLSTKNKGPLPNPPAKGPAPIGVLP